MFVWTLRGPEREQQFGYACIWGKRAELSARR